MHFMLTALVNGVKSLPVATGQRGLCPECGTEVMSKCGDINIWHWSHVSLVDCDLWGEPESAWHLNWKRGLPLDWIEVLMEENGQKHRADIRLPNGRVIELQHSSISVAEVEKREQFYKKMVWIFDVAEAATTIAKTDYYYSVDLNDVSVREIYRLHLFNRHGTESTYRTFRWRHAKKHIAYTNKPVFLDLGDDRILHLKTMDHESPVRGSGYLHPKSKLVDQIAKGQL